MTVTCRACGMLLWLTTKMIPSPRRFHSCGRFLHKGTHQRRVEPCELRVHLHAERRHGQGLQETESRSEHRHLDLFKITQHFPQFPQIFWIAVFIKFSSWSGPSVRRSVRTPTFVENVLQPKGDAAELW